MNIQFLYIMRNLLLTNFTNSFISLSITSQNIKCLHIELSMFAKVIICNNFIEIYQLMMKVVQLFRCALLTFQQKQDLQQSLI